MNISLVWKLSARKRKICFLAFFSEAMCSKDLFLCFLMIYLSDLEKYFIKFEFKAVKGLGTIKVGT